MAFDVNTDYKAKQNEIKKQMDAETDPAKKAALQAEFDAAGQSRNEKIASNLQKYGQYATTPELDAVSKIQANQRGNMAYDAGTDYTALQNSLKNQMGTETDPDRRAALQRLYDTAEQSRIAKMASSLQKYGKYATDSELDAAAGIQANNQIGTTYENQAKTIGEYYDTAKQNANNDALSRGMARSSFVSDRMAGLDAKRADALTSNDAAKALAIQNAKTAILNNYQTNAANALANEKSEFANTIGAYYNDYQAEINRVLNNNDASDDWKVPYLQAARNQKLHDQATAQAAADQQAFENQLALDKLAISSSKSYRSGRHSGGSRGNSGNSGSDTTGTTGTTGSNLFGNTSAAQTAANNSVATVDSASNLSSLEYKLSQIEGSQSGVQSKAANIIKQYLNSGAISEATAKKYLSQYGL